jgi:hypothetical protein
MKSEENGNASERLSLEDSEAIIQRLSQLREDTTNEQEAAELARLIDRVACKPTPDIYHVAWPDGSIYRERWMIHVWHKVPLDILSQACLRAKEDTGPHYLMFMEPPGYQPKADFTCWICGRQQPHPHSDAEVAAARKTLELFHDNVWTHLCEAQAARSAAREIGDPQPAAAPDAGEPCDSAGTKKENRVSEIPRRCRFDLSTPAELAIRAAVDAVEALPADVRLTTAVILLGQAREAVADFVDGVSLHTTEWYERKAAEEEGHDVSAGGELPTVALPAHQERTEPTEGEIRTRLHENNVRKVEVVVPTVTVRHAEPCIGQSADEAMEPEGAPARAAEWQPIETAPRGRRVLALMKPEPLASEGEIAWAYWTTVEDEPFEPEGMWTYDHTGELCEPTHWLPLPTLPPCALTGNSKSEK